MTSKKPFDCVEFKNGLQTQLAKEYEGLADEEIRARIQKKLASSDHPMAQLWREVTKPRETTVIK